MFSEDEIEALVLGSRWVAERGDGLLGSAARNAVAKIAAVLPAALRDKLEPANFWPGPAERSGPVRSELASIRKAIRANEDDIRYRDGQRRASQRTLWPFALGFFDKGACGGRLVRAPARIFAISAPIGSQALPSPRRAIHAVGRRY